MRTIRSYNKLVNEIINLQIPFRIEIVGYVKYDIIYTMLVIRHVSKTAKKNVVISSGIHGDEYFAVHVLLKWLQQFNPEILKDFNFTIFPICNPFGFAKSSRKNGARQMVNNSSKFCKDSPVQELAILYDNMPSSPDLYLDIHGDTGKQGVYAYERTPDGNKSIVAPALLENDLLLPYEKVGTIYKCKVTDGVIITPAEDVGLEGVLESVGATYTIAIELPGKCDGQKRMQGGIAIINSILKNLQGIK
jgi:predicted deacylase